MAPLKMSLKNERCLSYKKATFPTCFWVRFLGLWIRPALVLPRQNKKHNIPWTPQNTSCVFLFRAAVCCDTTCCENIRKHRFRPPLCEKQRSQLRLKCQTFRTEIQFCIPREFFSDLGQPICSAKALPVPPLSFRQ